VKGAKTRGFALKSEFVLQVAIARSVVTTSYYPVCTCSKQG